MTERRATGVEKTVLGGGFDWARSFRCECGFPPRLVKLRNSGRWSHSVIWDFPSKLLRDLPDGNSAGSEDEFPFHWICRFSGVLRQDWKTGATLVGCTFNGPAPLALEDVRKGYKAFLDYDMMILEKKWVFRGPGILLWPQFVDSHPGVDTVVRSEASDEERGSQDPLIKPGEDDFRNPGEAGTMGPSDSDSDVAILL
jgi:hypothetical protein